MGYILKNNGGDATSTNQVAQIDIQLESNAFSQGSVFKELNTGKSVFLTDSVESIFKKQIQTYSTTQVFTATDSNIADLGTQVQTFLSNSPGIFIISINYGDSGGIGALAHSCMIVYNI